MYECVLCKRRLLLNEWNAPQTNKTIKVGNSKATKSTGENMKNTHFTPFPQTAKYKHNNIAMFVQNVFFVFLSALFFRLCENGKRMCSSLFDFFLCLYSLWHDTFQELVAADFVFFFVLMLEVWMRTEIQQRTDAMCFLNMSVWVCVWPRKKIISRHCEANGKALHGKFIYHFCLFVRLAS